MKLNEQAQQLGGLTISIPYVLIDAIKKDYVYTLEDLINSEDPFLPHLNEWIALAKNKVEILPCDHPRAQEALLHTQVSTHSPMGAIVYETGGLLVDNGWMRILGSGCDRMQRSIPSWNKGKTFTVDGEIPPYLLIADDAIGGFFALNGGFFGNDKGNIYYFSPDSLEWMSMGFGYSNFLLFCFETNMNDFYDGLRWKTWKEDVKELKPDYAYSFLPFLWTKEAENIDRVSRKIMPIEEVYDFNLGMNQK